MPLNSLPPMGNPVSGKQVHRALNGPYDHIEDTSSGSADAATINAILAMLRATGLLKTRLVWVLAGAIWNDAGGWDDTAIWIDQ